MRDDPAVIILVTRAQDGDQEAWDEIIERFAPLVWSICHRFRLSDADAHDVGQNVWLRLVEHLDVLREPAALPGWLATTTRRECIRVQRLGWKRDRQLADPELDVPADEDQTQVDQWLIAAERQAALRAAFADLGDRCRELLGMLMADPPMLTFVPFPNPYTHDDAVRYITEVAMVGRASGSAIDCALTERGSGEVVGAAGLRAPGTRTNAAEIGYWVGTASQGNGYASEAARSLAAWAFERGGVTRAEIRCAVGNVASAKVALNAGFRFEGILRGDAVTPDGPADDAVFGRIAADHWLRNARSFLAAYDRPEIIALLARRFVVPRGMARLWWSVRTTYLSRAELTRRIGELRAALPSIAA
jgi:RNA polymerase sigma factor (sigma-70 family)